MNVQEQRLREYIDSVVNAAPPLTPEQRDRLALVLRPRDPQPSGATALGEMLKEGER